MPAPITPWVATGARTHSAAELVRERDMETDQGAVRAAMGESSQEEGQGGDSQGQDSP